MSTTDSSKTRTAQSKGEDAAADKRDEQTKGQDEGLSTQENHSSSEPSK